MTTARTHQRNVSRGQGATPLRGAARPRVAEPKPDDYVPISAASFDGAAFGSELGDEIGDPPFDPASLGFDPAEHTVDDVKAFVGENPQAALAVLELELNGKGRSTLVDWLDDFTTPADEPADDDQE